MHWEILLLLVNQEDLLNEAAALGLKITKSLFTDIEPSCDKIDPSDDSSMSSKNTVSIFIWFLWFLFWRVLSFKSSLFHICLHLQGHKRKNNKKNKRDKKDKSAGKKPVMAGNPPPLVFKLPCDNVSSAYLNKFNVLFSLTNTQLFSGYGIWSRHGPRVPEEGTASTLQIGM